MLGMPFVTITSYLSKIMRVNTFKNYCEGKNRGSKPRQVSDQLRLHQQFGRNLNKLWLRSKNSVSNPYTETVNC